MDGSFALPAQWPLLEDRAQGAVIAERPASEPHPAISPRLFFREAFPKPSGTFPRVHAPPKLTLERLGRVILGPRRTLFNREPAGLLPEAFNRLRRRRLHPCFDVADGLFQARVPADYATCRTIDEPVYWADTYFPEIYGHVLLEVLPQLWGYRDAGVEKLATSVAPDRTFVAMLRALDIAPEAILQLDGCIAPPEVYVATPPVMLRDYVHPEAREILGRLGRLGKESDAPAPERLYLSRSGTGRRMLRNEAEIEAIFEAAGFLIYHPQDHAIEDQIRTFSGARFIAGPGGSALHNAVFSERLERLLILSSPDWFTIIDPLLHQEEGRLALLFGDVVEAPLVRPEDRDWTIDAHQVRLALRFHMGL
jgi:hypothetical protein